MKIEGFLNMPVNIDDRGRMRVRGRVRAWRVDDGKGGEPPAGGGVALPHSRATAPRGQRR
jgi:hypothetical protein